MKHIIKEIAIIIAGGGLISAIVCALFVSADFAYKAGQCNAIGDIYNVSVKYIFFDDCYINHDGALLTKDQFIRTQQEKPQ